MDDTPEQLLRDAKEWLKFQEACYKQVNEDVAVLRPEPLSFSGAQDMVASVLALIPDDPPRFETMYEVLKIVEDRKFWVDISAAYQDGEATDPNVPFTDDNTLLRHAVAVEKIYKKHGLDKIEDLLLDEV